MRFYISDIFCFSNRLSEKNSGSEGPVIEPDGKDGTEASGPSSEEAKSPFDATEEEEDEEDFVDEDYLKDLELSMSEEEKQVPVI